MTENLKELLREMKEYKDGFMSGMYPPEEDIEELLDYIEEQNKEIERLNENNQAYQEEVCRVWEERDNLYRRILEAVEYIEKWQSFQHTNGTTHEELKNLKDILKGEIK